MKDLSLKVTASLCTGLINASIFVGMAWAGFIDEPPKENPEPPTFHWVDVAPVVRKGEIKKKNTLPRITKAPEAPPPEADRASISREIEEEEERKKEELEREMKRKRELAEQRHRDEEAQRLKEERKRKREERKALERKRAMARAIAEVDKRADEEDNPGGAPDGFEYGTSTDPSATRHRMAYISRVSLMLQRQFEVPSTIPAELRKELKAKVHFKINQDGRLKGAPRLIKGSGNRFFDQAALRAVRKFGAGSQLRIPLPEKRHKGLRRYLLKEGITAVMQAIK